MFKKPTLLFSDKNNVFYQSVRYESIESFSAFDASDAGIDFASDWVYACNKRNELFLTNGLNLRLFSMDTGEMNTLADLGGERVTSYAGMNDRYLAYRHAENAWWEDNFLHIYDLETGEDKVIFEETLINDSPVVFLGDSVYFDDFYEHSDKMRYYNLYSYDLKSEQVTMLYADAQHPVVYNGGLCRFETNRETQNLAMLNMDNKKILSIDGYDTSFVSWHSENEAIAFSCKIDEKTATEYLSDWPGFSGFGAFVGIADSYSVLHNKKYVPILISRSSSTYGLGRMYTDGRYCIWDNPSEAPMYYDIEEEVIVRLDSLPEGRYSSLLGANGPVFVNLDTSTVYYK